MIKVKAILNEKGCIIPESIPEKHIGSFSDKEFFYFFESIDERDNFMNELPVLPIEEIEQPKVDLKSILMNASSEEIAYIKQLLK